MTEAQIDDGDIELLTSSVIYGEEGNAWLDPEARPKLEEWIKGAPARGELMQTAVMLMTFAEVLDENGCPRAAVELLDLATPLTPHLREKNVDEARSVREERKAAFQKMVDDKSGSRAPMADDASKPDVKGKVKRGLR